MSQPRDLPPGALYATWEDERGKALAIHNATAALQKVEPVVRAAGSDIFFNIAPGGISVRDNYTRRDYDLFRNHHKHPVRPHHIIRDCMLAYDNVGLVRNVVDLMSDFAVQGLQIVHPNERVEKWYKEWFRRVDALERSERFLNVLYRCGNVIVKRQTAKLTPAQEERIRRSTAAPESEMADPPALGKREIPWRYVFLNPLAMEILGGAMAAFVGKEAFVYALRIPEEIIRIVKNPVGLMEPEMVRRLPPQLRKIIESGKRFFPLDRDKLYVAHYKRDDWLAWAKPMLHPILKDLQMLEKMKLADLSALDGAISCIRVWKLGSLEARIMPTEASINRLAYMLTNNVGGGVMDLVWGPDIDLVETSTNVHRFLGQTKYQPVLDAIFQGLGIPPSLTGSNGAGTFSNTFVSLKTLVERLEYGRSLLREFWAHEIRLVQKAMGFRFPAKVVFDKLLTDEAAEKQLLLHLWDRDLVSDAAVQENFGLEADIESVRIRRQQRRIKEGKVPPKASPFHDPQEEYGLKKIFAQQGVITPSQGGVELDDNEGGQKSFVDQQADQQVKTQRDQNDHQFRTERLQLRHGVHPNQLQQGPVKKGMPGQGRPKQARDQEKRKERNPKIRTHAFVRDVAWAESAQATITRLTLPAYLRSLDKAELSADEWRDFDACAFGILMQLPPGVEFGRGEVGRALAAPLAVPSAAMRLLERTLSQHADKHGHPPGAEAVSRYQSSVYALTRPGNTDA